MELSVVRRIFVDRFDSASHITGKKRTYEAVKAAVLEAGMFSTFEASDNQRDAVLFMRLMKDPEIEVFEMGFPWHGVRRRT